MSLFSRIIRNNFETALYESFLYFTSSIIHFQFEEFFIGYSFQNLRGRICCLNLISFTSCFHFFYFDTGSQLPDDLADQSDVSVGCLASAKVL